ncbi:protein FLX-like 1 isoform X1 [Sesamum indicum]|uniref:Protein FLX-like 1 isoform X1 n=2 Tax=Sesamum indicum TaxID=4182 RepID=A0A8M8V732_SESIN|nr:protein FLX-like 1 isoform X1 [Sesamum indicum]
MIISSGFLFRLAKRINKTKYITRMSTRNRGPPIPPKGGPHGGLPQPPIHEQPFARGLRGVPHPALHDEMREAHYSLSGPRPLPPHPVIIEERLAAQHDDIQALLVDNQRLAATHVALRQELEVAQYELQRADKYARTLHAEKESETRELYEKSVKMENELHALNAMRSELMQVHMDIKELTAAREDLTAQVQMMTQDLGRVTSDLQQVPTIKSEIEGLRHELERARAAVEHEKKGFSESFDHGKVMENKLITMAREMEKLRAELANAEKRAHAVAAVGNPGVNYNANYGNPESGYPGNPYSVGYGMMPANSMHQAPAGAEGYPQYPPGPGAWGSYDTQRAQGPR